MTASSTARESMSIAALERAGRGIPVFPCDPKTKRPLTVHGFKDATTSAEQVEAWWQQHPDAMIGVPTGGPSGVFALDIDLDQTKGLDGYVSLAALEDRHGRLPETVTQQTPRGGEHRLFKWPGRKIKNSTSALGKGLDVRGDGGYIIIAPSVNVEGQCYEFTSVGEPAEAPRWLLGLVTGENQEHAHSILTAEAQAVASAPIGQRNDTLNVAAFRLGGLIGSGDLREDSAVAELLAAALRAGLTQTEARRTIQSGLTARKTSPRTVEAQRGAGVSTHGPGGSPADVEWPTLDPAALYGLAGDIVRVVEPHTESDPVGILAQVLLAFGAIVGRGPHVAVEGDQHHCNLFLLLVGNTSKGRKGTSWGRVRQIFERQYGWVITVSGLSSGEGLKWNVRDPVEIKSAKDGGDPGIADKRLLVVESEFAQALRATTRTGNTLSSTIREAWDTGNLRTLTKNDPIVATGAHVAIIGHITVTELKSELTETDRGNGFANRFLFACVKRSKTLPFGGGDIDENILSNLVVRLTDATTAARQHGRALTMSNAARVEWERVYPALSEGLEGMLGAVTGRAEAQCLRLALIYALLDKATEIDAPHLFAAIALWEYCEQSARFIFGSALGSRVADEILRALRSKGQSGLTRTDISKLFKGHQSADKISMALDILRQRNLAHQDSWPTDGRPVEVWRARLVK